MFIRISSSKKLSKPAAVAAAVGVLAIGVLLLVFGMVLLAGALALAGGLTAVALVRRALGPAKPSTTPRIEDGRIVLDPSLEVMPRLHPLPDELAPGLPELREDEEPIEDAELLDDAEPGSDDARGEPR